MESKSMFDPYPIEKIQPLVEKNTMNLVELMYSHGILRKKNPLEMTNMPISVNPKYISRAQYTELQSNCLSFHRIMEMLYDRFDELIEFYENYSHGDELVAILSKIYRQSKLEGKNPLKPECLIIRNDFMYDLGSQTFQEVEFNTMSIGLGQQSTSLQKLTSLFYNSFLKIELPLVPNSNSERQIETFRQVFNLYGNKDAVFLEVMLPDEPNIFDSIHNEKLLAQIGIRTIRITLNEITPENYRLDKETKKLFVFDKEVAVVYMRSLYDPSHFDDNRIDFWAKAEASNAAVIPSVTSFIIGIKLTQHLFTSDTLLKKYNLEDIKKNSFRKHFCDTKNIESDFENNKDKLLEFLKVNKEKVLLKSYKEGGLGLLLGGNEMISYTEKASLQDLQQLLIAHRIDTPFYESLTLVNHEVKFVKESISEISIFSSFIMKKGDKGWKSEWEQVWDYLFRSKYRQEIKGGISVGASFMDTLVFID
jgi:hypothetical protein